MLPADSAYLLVYASKISWHQYYRLLACFCYQLRKDQTELFAGGGGHRVSNYVHALRGVAAWAVLERGKNLKFTSGEVDIDATKIMVDRSTLA